MHHIAIKELFPFHVPRKKKREPSCSSKWRPIPDTANYIIKVQTHKHQPVKYK